jgi:hypothetical protein
MIRAEAKNRIDAPLRGRLDAQYVLLRRQPPRAISLADAVKYAATMAASLSRLRR